MVSRPVDAVTFDYWSTLVYEDPPRLLRDRRIAAWSRLLRDAGQARPDARLVDAFDESWISFERSWEVNEQYGPTDAVDAAMASLGLDGREELRASLLAAFTDAWVGAELRVADGIAEALEDLRARGIRVGIVCDVGMTPSAALRSILEGQALLASFDHWSFSDEVGVYKPDPRIFRHALRGLGDPDPARTAHVGDRRRTDVAGALGMGMIAVRYRGASDDTGQGPDAHIVIDHHRDLADALGLA
ncbi:MAG TPA: HAD family hydrolase [Actinomycetota bacterium]|jgi:putative hydrolase of the HAD superfamily